MKKKELAISIYNDLVDELYTDNIIDHREEILEIIESRLSSYLIIDGGIIFTDDKGNIRI